MGIESRGIFGTDISMSRALFSCIPVVGTGMTIYNQALNVKQAVQFNRRTRGILNQYYAIYPHPTPPGTSLAKQERAVEAWMAMAAGIREERKHLWRNVAVSAACGIVSFVLFYVTLTKITLIATPFFATCLIWTKAFTFAINFQAFLLGITRDCPCFKDFPDVERNVGGIGRSVPAIELNGECGFI